MDEAKNLHALPTQEKWIKLSNNEVKHIFMYYILIFLASLALCVFLISSLFPPEDKGIELDCLILFSFTFGLLGSIFYYIRKLYKSCIQLLIDTDGEASSIAGLGAKIYFYLRPIMGAVLSFIIILGIYGGFFFLQDQPSINEEKFLIFSAIFSFIIGFSNGKIIVRLDSSSEKIAELIKFTKEP